MKIISNYKDYYDSSQKYGIDKSILYIRKEEIIKLKEKDVKLPQGMKIEKLDDTLEKGKGIIGFCGKLYPYYIFGILNKIYLNNIKDLNNFVKKKYNKKEIEKFYLKDLEEKRYSIYRKKWFNTNYFTYNMVESYFTKYTGIKDTTDFFNKYKVPIFKIEMVANDYYELTLNPNLKKLNFMKIMNPFITYQEIEMFISGVIGIKNPQLIDISNEDMIKKKGFDKWSFRKQSKNK